MEEKVTFDELDGALRRCGASWDAAQSHGLLTGRLAIAGVPAAPDWMLQVLEGTDAANALRAECQRVLELLYQSTYWQLSERLSEFVPVLPADEDDVSMRVAALGHWCEGFLHGLVSARHGNALRERLAGEPFADIIKDLLQITRAGLDEESDEEDNESAYVELVEYVRVAAQLCYEELADIRYSTTESK